MPAMMDTIVQSNAHIPTWFGVGGGADLLAQPTDLEGLRDVLLAFAGGPVRVLGDGANLLVDDAGVDGLVVSLEQLASVERLGPIAELDGCELVRVGAGARLPRLVVDMVRQGLAGLEVLAGIPASLGGAAVMNAGGAYGSMADVVYAIHAMTRSGEQLTIPYSQLSFDYRHSGLGHLIVIGVDLALRPVEKGEKAGLRQRLLEVMAYKKQSQPLGERSAGCIFKNPKVDGRSMSAGKLIDAAGCKGLTQGGARISQVHANFIEAGAGCTAGDIITLMEEAGRRVQERFAVELEPEVVVWRREKKS